MPLGMEVSIGPGDFVLDGNPCSFPQKAYVYCDQTFDASGTTWYREVGLGPGDIVLDGVHSSPKRGTSPIFGPHLLWLNGPPISATAELLFYICKRISLKVVHERTAVQIGMKEDRKA